MPTPRRPAPGPGPVLLVALLALLAAAPIMAAVNVTVRGRVVTTGFADALFVHDNLVFFMLSNPPNRTLNIYDADDPASPVLLSQTTLSTTNSIADMHGIYVSNGILYCGLERTGGGFFAADVSDPRNPVQLSFTPVPGGVHNMRFDGRYLYIMSDSTAEIDFLVYDMIDPRNPVQVNQFLLSAGAGFCHDLSIVNGVGYASMWDDGLYLLDLSDPTRNPLPVLASTATGSNTHSAWPTADLRTVITCHEDYDIGVNFWDVTSTPFPNLANYQSHTNVAPPDLRTIVHDVMVVGKFAYITYYPEGLRILDVSNPAAPVEVGSLVTGGPCSAFCSAIAQWVEDGLVYDLDMQTGLYIASFDLPHDAPITLYAVKSPSASDVVTYWNHTGESQYTVRRYVTRASVAGALNRDVDAKTGFTDAGAIAFGGPGQMLYYYKINGPWK